MIFRVFIQCLVQSVLAVLTMMPVFAAESIAKIEHHETILTTETGGYELKLQSIANLSNITVDGYKVSELSGLAWDEDEGLLYALSDNGYLLHLRPVFADNKLTDVLLITGYALRDTNQRALRYKEADSEGMAIKHGNNNIQGDTRLIISFERIPRIIEYKPDGTMIAIIPLPTELSTITNYRSENRSLEAIAIHPEYGIITGTELPLAGNDSRKLDIYSVKGEHWSFPAHNQYEGALVDMTSMGDGSILALERAYGGIFPVLEISLHRIMLDKDKSAIDTIYTFAPDNGLLNENFEGITRFRGNSYFMISDDNNHPLKRTILVYFSVIKK